MPPRGGRDIIFSDVREISIVGMVIANNAVKLRAIRTRVLADSITFANVNMVSTTTIARVLEKHKIRMKQFSTVPFERNREHVKELQYHYVQVICLFSYQTGYIQLCRMQITVKLSVI